MPQLSDAQNAKKYLDQPHHRYVNGIGETIRFIYTAALMTLTLI